ncbi:ADP-ribosylglycohydrolase family protein [Deinococcus sp. KSM4-11]|uniref:ADP-ribosylglycohydrolase family protein n=1 Tax=Deinococcus sp. KSM4-11 TaxID=2568654 RepID=UPI0010A38466|nr:ADP-ribosylglycohydrolase family protein [Deinococcus sp. KSM4-11]THF87156.1 ADP-ribosylglycohydrolase family protein [Deinococcus sp. KSM4-11]
MSVRITWLALEERLEHEFRQLREEGLDPGELERAWAELEGAPAATRREGAGALLDRARELTSVHDDGEAPLLLEGQPAPSLDRSDLLRRLHAGWTGRMAGCLLGKPVEKIPREGIRELLQSGGQWPLDDYFTARGIPHEVLARWPWNRASAPTSLRETITCMPEDDDINYAMLNLAVLEGAGLDFTTEDVATAWLSMMPVLTTFTAERVAYQNLLEKREPPETARHRNPYREWIGAQIRADVWGWAAPGDPALAAALARRDAQLSHTGNGVYAEMWVAAMVAAAFTHADVRAVVEAGLRVIPHGSRLAEAVRFALELPGQTQDWEGALDLLQARYGHYHWVHAINNAALVAAALLYGDGDYSTSICLAVMGGWDTDCNGATVGSIVGTLTGEVPARWSDPLRGEVRSSLRGFDHARIDDLAARTLAVIPQPVAVIR